MFRAGTGSVIAKTTTDGDGLFSVDVPPGEYDLRPDVQGPETIAEKAEGVQVVEGRTTTVRIVIDTGIRSVESATPTPAPAPSPVQEAEGITLNAVGDVSLARELVLRIDENGTEYPFALVRELYAAADVSFANLEGAITARGEPLPKSYTFRNPPEHAQALVDGGVDVVSLANNHTLDYGPEGLIDTELAMVGAGIAHVGAGLDDASAYVPAYVTVEGIRLAFLAYANVPSEPNFDTTQLAAGPGKPGVAWATAGQVYLDVQAAKKQADHVIVSFHFGDEYRTEPNLLQVSLARAAIDAGASVVLGHHPHVLQGIEEYRGGIIAYSLGNFIFDLDEVDLANVGPPPILSMILRIRLSKTAVLGYEPLAVVLDANADRPRLATTEEREQLEAKLAELSALIPAP